MCWSGCCWGGRGKTSNRLPFSPQVLFDLPLLCPSQVPLLFSARSPSAVLPFPSVSLPLPISTGSLVADLPFLITVFHSHTCPSPTPDPKTQRMRRRPKLLSLSKRGGIIYHVQSQPVISGMRPARMLNAQSPYARKKGETTRPAPPLCQTDIELALTISFDFSAVKLSSPPTFSPSVTSTLLSSKNDGVAQAHDASDRDAARHSQVPA